MRTLVMGGTAQGWLTLPNNIGNSVPTTFRNMVSIVLLWTVISGFMPIGSQSEAMKASPHTFILKQEDEDIVLKIKGDELDHWVTNQYDYTVVRDDVGDYRFAALSSDKKKLVPTDQKVKNAPPKHTTTKDLRPHKKVKQKKNTKSDEESGKIVLYGEVPNRSRRHKRYHRGSGDGPAVMDDNIPFSESATRTISQDERDDSNPAVSEDHHRRMESTGLLKNLVVLMQFQDHVDRLLPSKEDITVLMNSETEDADLAPTGSVKMLYRQNSYGLLTIESEVTDWIVLNNTEAYYANGNSGLSREKTFHEALRYALNELEEISFNFTNFDRDGVNGIDSITFLTSGYGAEWGADDMNGTSYQNRIWSHKWRLSGQGWTSPSTGVTITDYFVSPSLWGITGNEIGRRGVIAHEIGHFLGLPDLYDTDNTGNGLGYFCMMANSWGSDGTQWNPPELSAWTKMELGWTTPQTPLFGVENIVARSEGYPRTEPLNRLYKIGDGAFGFPDGEYLLIEFRQTALLQGGIAIYHVDEQQNGFNTEGYPNQGDDFSDEANSGSIVPWPENGNHYKVALVQADENFELERKINQGDSDDLYTIGQSLLPSTEVNGTYPNTDSYQKGNITGTGVRICVTTGIQESYMAFVFADKNPIHRWVTLLYDDFESVVSSNIFFQADAVVVEKEICLGSKCASVKESTTSMYAATMSAAIKTVCFSEIRVSFQFCSIGLLKGERIYLEYSLGENFNDANSWTILKVWVKGRGGIDNFQNRIWYQKSQNLDLSNTDASNVILRFRSTTLMRKIFIDNLKIEGKM